MKSILRSLWDLLSYPMTNLIIGIIGLLFLFFLYSYMGWLIPDNKWVFFGVCLFIFCDILGYGFSGLFKKRNSPPSGEDK